MLIKQVKYRNYKALRDGLLPLGQFTLILGPNGSGKSTALQALRNAGGRGLNVESARSAGARMDEPIMVEVLWEKPLKGLASRATWVGGTSAPDVSFLNVKMSQDEQPRYRQALSGMPIYYLDPQQAANPNLLQQKAVLGDRGANLVGVLDSLRDQHPERFDALNTELARWMPEFDRVLFEVPEAGQRAFKLRTKTGAQIPARELSDGTLLALSILVVAHNPEPAPIICFEEPDRGIHPRLLIDVRDALYRLAYPKAFEDARQATQVIATTHSPYLLDLFKDHPEEIVIADKRDGSTVFERLADRADLEELLSDVHLGEAWYGGILGGVPPKR